MNVLIIEDDQLNRETLAELLRMDGFRVDAAGDGREALNYLRAVDARYDAVVTDMVMPVMDGKELLGVMTPEERQRTIVCTALSEADLKELQLPADVGAVLRKSVPPGEISAAIRKLTSKGA